MPGKPEIKSNLNYIPEDDRLSLGGVEVSCFRTMHDAAYSVGYRFEGEETLGFATDTGSINDELIAGLEGADTALIEANHDIAMLKTERIRIFEAQNTCSHRAFVK